MSRYIGFTIGPIYKTLQNAKKTRELWAGSYIFSYIMKRIIQKFKNRDFVIPYVDINDQTFKDLLTYNMPVGIFHDRMIFMARDDNDFDNLKKIISEIRNDISANVAKDLGLKPDNVTGFFKSYFQLYFCEKEYDDSADYKQINKEMNSYLDSLELQSSFTPPYEKDYVAEFLKNVNKTFLIDKAFGKGKHRRFHSIPEIATVSLGLMDSDQGKYHEIFDLYDDKDDKDYDIYEDIKEKFNLKDSELKRYHRYIAIVHADGDNVGDAIKQLGNNDDFKKFSKALFEFDLDAHKLINGFGCEAIFAGGDDLLFFAPVVNGSKSIFNLIDDIDSAFNRVFKDKEMACPTLSFGISISYYKFPLYEALNISRDLLRRAKDFPNKNAVAFRVLKHSGQYFEGAFEKETNEHCNFKDMLQDINTADGGRLMASVIHNLFAQKAILDVIGNHEKRLQNFFHNTFNESIHKLTHNVIQLENIRKLIFSVFVSPGYKADEKVKTIYGSLRLNKFMRE